MKVKINDLPTMAVHFFIAPNRIIFCDIDYHTFIIAETEEEFEKDFCLDSNSFDLMKKLTTNRKITFENNQVVVESDEGKYLCSKLDKTMPQILFVDGSNCIFDKIYNVQDLKNARKAVSTQKVRQMLCGVIFNSDGEIFATDSVRIYYNELQTDKNQLSGWSVPTNFIDMLSGDKAHIYFSQKSVLAISSAGYKIQSVVYSGVIPDLKKIISSFTPIEFEFMKTEQINLFTSDSVLLTNINNNLNIKFLNETNEFNLNYPLLYNCEDFVLKIKADFFTDALNSFKEDKICIQTNHKFIRINNQIIIGCQSQKVN